MSTLLSKFIPLSKSVVLNGKQLVDFLNTDEINKADKMMPLIRGFAAHSHAMLTEIKDALTATKSRADAQPDFLLSHTKLNDNMDECRSSVLKMVTSSRNLANNSLDFMSRQNLEQTFSELVKSVKALVHSISNFDVACANDDDEKKQETLKRSDAVGAASASDATDDLRVLSQKSSQLIDALSVVLSQRADKDGQTIAAATQAAVRATVALSDAGEKEGLNVDSLRNCAVRLVHGIKSFLATMKAGDNVDRSVIRSLRTMEFEINDLETRIKKKEKELERVREQARQTAMDDQLNEELNDIKPSQQQQKNNDKESEKKVVAAAKTPEPVVVEEQKKKKRRPPP